jgi:soluble lytic murein transglycosylase
MNQRWNQTLRFVAALLAIGTICALYWWRSSRLEHSQDSVIRAAASRYGVDPSLVKAVVWQESRFNPGIRGKANEIGLMQLQEVTAQEWADAEHVRPFQHEHCFNPLTNTLAGAWYLKKLLRRYGHTDNPVPYALADYNAGRGNVLKWNSGEASTNSAVFLQQIGFPGTKAYVKSVMARHRRYRPIFGAAGT